MVKSLKRRPAARPGLWLNMLNRMIKKVHIRDCWTWLIDSEMDLYLNRVFEGRLLMIMEYIIPCIRWSSTLFEI